MKYNKKGMLLVFFSGLITFCNGQTSADFNPDTIVDISNSDYIKSGNRINNAALSDYIKATTMVIINRKKYENMNVVAQLDKYKDEIKRIEIITDADKMAKYTKLYFIKKILLFKVKRALAKKIAINSRQR
jgi:hypothetical protein